MNESLPKYGVVHRTLPKQHVWAGDWGRVLRREINEHGLHYVLDMKVDGERAEVAIHEVNLNLIPEN